MTVLYAIAADGGARRLPCRTISVPGPTGINWHHCTCRPGIRVADPARILHVGEKPAERVAAMSAEEEHDMSTEDAATLLRRAATHLRELDGAATPRPWRHAGRFRIETPGVEVDEANWGGVDDDGNLLTEYQLTLTQDSGAWREADAALLVPLRNAAADIADWLDEEADDWDEGDPNPGFASVRVALAILGETLEGSTT